MKADTAKFTLRTDPDLLKKFHFVADYNGRSANREIEVLMKKHVSEFESINGKITFE
ncbi:MAG: Arc family DNA-binding protein [Lachnospiraceae bacterium]|nr:Arc family DNA-binding protein [Lachnospiraceae bacterium]